MKKLYIDTSNSGISGDMFLSALLGLIETPENIIEKLEGLKSLFPDVSTLKITLKQIEKKGIKINKLEITIKEKKDHRTAKFLRKGLQKFLANSTLSERGKHYAKKVLDNLISAEAAVHGKNNENIHLHELSSIDTFIDILGVTMILEELELFNHESEIYVSSLPLGGGSIKTAHGILPVPAPATAKILEESNLIIQQGPIDSELVTPTGAALLTALDPSIEQYEMKLKKIAYSTGEKSFKDFPNILRLLYGDSHAINTSNSKQNLMHYAQKIVEIETNIDDASGEEIGDFITSLQEKNIVDVQVIPTTTKKNRTGQIIKILTPPEHKDEIIKFTLLELGTLGIRYRKLDRICVDRSIEKTEIVIREKLYEVSYKLSYIGSDPDNRKIINIKPEYEDLKIISKETQIPVRKLRSLVFGKLMELYPDYLS